MKSKPKILFLLKLPPPLTGATLMNSYANESKLLNDAFAIKTLPIHYSKSVSDLGGLSYFKFFEIFRIAFTLIWSLISYRPRFVYFQISPLGFAFIRDLLFVTIIKLCNVSIVYHLHGKGIKQAAQKWYWQLLYKYAFRNEKIICLSQSLTADIDVVYKGQAYIVPNAIPLHLHTLPPKIENEVVEILYLSNLFISKGILVFIDSLAQLKNKNIQFRASIVGGVADLNEKSINELLGQKGLTNHVQYLGPKYDNDKWAQYLQSDIFVFPTLNDIWGLVILEAMQAGLPVIASNDGAIAEIVDEGITGFVFEKANVNELTTKIELLISDVDLRKRMGMKGREKYITTYTLEVFENSLFNTFNLILSK